MNIEYFLLDKDMSTESKYVIKSNISKPDFVRTTSSGQPVVYIANRIYGKATLNDKLKVIDSKGHITTLFPTKNWYNGNRVFSGDINNQDLLLLTTKNNFTNCEMLLFKDGKVCRNEIVFKLCNGFYNEVLSQLKSK